MSASVSVNPPIITQQTGNGPIPSVSRLYTFSLNLTTGNPVQFDLRSLQNNSAFKEAQGIFIDNQYNTASVSVSLPNGLVLTVPGNSQGCMPLYFPIATPVLAFSGNGNVTIVLLNFPSPAAVWSTISSSIQVIGGFAQIYDPTVAGLIQAPEGSLAGGAAGTVSVAIGGVYVSTVPLLTTGQQAAAAFTQQGVLKTASGGQSSFLNATAGTIVKASPGRVGKVIVQITPTATAYVLDSVTAAQTAANTVLTIPIGTVAGTIYNLDFPCLTGISVVPGGGTLAGSFD